MDVKGRRESTNVLDLRNFTGKKRPNNFSVADDEQLGSYLHLSVSHPQYVEYWNKGIQKIFAKYGLTAPVVSKDNAKDVALQYQVHAAIEDFARDNKGSTKAQHVLGEIPEIIRGAKILEKVTQLRKDVQAAQNVNKAVRIKHPMKDEYFTFPPGTDPKYAEETVRKMLLSKARGGTEYIDMPTELPADRMKVLRDAEAKNQELQAKIKDLESKRELSKVSPGLYYDDKVDTYWRVTDQGHFEQAYVGKSGSDIADVIGEEAISHSKTKPTTQRENVELRILESAHDAGLSLQESLDLVNKAVPPEPVK